MEGGKRKHVVKSGLQMHEICVRRAQEIFARENIDLVMPEMMVTMVRRENKRPTIRMLGVGLLRESVT
jgi:hypothetical protein